MQSVGGMTLSVSFSRELRIYLPAGLMRNGETGVPKPNRYKPEPAEPPNKYERNMLEGRGVPAMHILTRVAVQIHHVNTRK